MRYLIVMMLVTALLSAESEMPDLRFLRGSSVAHLRVFNALPGVDVRLGEGDVVFSGVKIVRVSLIDFNDVGDRLAFPKDGSLYAKLKVLSVINCRVAQDIPGYITGLNDLVQLDLSRNAIGGDLALLTLPKKLRVFKISDNPIKGSVNRHISEAHNLQFLDIGNTNLEIDPLVIAGNMSLNKISFYSDNVKSSQVDWIKELSPRFIVNEFPVKEGNKSERIFYSVIRRDSQSKIDGRPAAEIMEELKKMYSSGGE
jgi:hypothetical protein